MRLDDVTEMAVVIPISIHAPRERCDAAEDVEPAPPLISIHAPRERCDYLVHCPDINGIAISIHAPRERCDKVIGYIEPGEEISIHAPRERCDAALKALREPLGNFNPRTA